MHHLQVYKQSYKGHSFPAPHQHQLLWHTCSSSPGPGQRTPVTKIQTICTRKGWRLRWRRKGKAGHRVLRCSITERK